MDTLSQTCFLFGRASSIR